MFRLTRAVTLPVDEVWQRVTDWRSHAAQVPLTRLSSVTDGPTGVGTVFTVRSAWGPIGFDDPMEVVRWEPPGEGPTGGYRLEKRGRIVGGWAEVEVLRQGSGSIVVWTEQLDIRPLPGLFDRLVARVGRAVFGRALNGLLEQPYD
ncbi:SRPBCC family protein [Streptomyces albipurpureus]|uniref:SRPBCC family protein n=1 Tax=Streptomyces albipurpureus TaxID=2897419 RepID=UPI0027E3D5F4|nr:SRPBCC family protein [Streptomyces sp. CWNU-1]